MIRCEHIILIILQNFSINPLICHHEISTICLTSFTSFTHILSFLKNLKIILSEIFCIFFHNPTQGQLYLDMRCF